MAELDEMISSILKDPQSMQLVTSLLSGLGENTPAPKKEEAPTLPDLEKLGGLMQKLGGPPDERCQLLMSLRPFVNKERQEKIDQSVKLLKLMGLAREMGGMGLV